MQKIRVLVLIMAILTFIPSTKVFADSPGDLMDFSVESANGEFLFVMLVKDIDDSYNEQGYIEEVETLRNAYPQSGLYRKDGSNTPLWTVDWNAKYVIVSSDGHHLVRWGPWARKNHYSEIAVEFYRDGKLLKSYKVEDLVADTSQLRFTQSHFDWAEEHNPDITNNTLWLKTYDNREYVFDITTGEVIEGTVPSEERSPSEVIQETLSSEDQSPLNLAVVATVVILLLGGAFAFWRWRKAQGQSQSL